jgi:hypothetical protein
MKIERFLFQPLNRWPRVRTTGRKRWPTLPVRCASGVVARRNEARQGHRCAAHAAAIIDLLEPLWEDSNDLSLTPDFTQFDYVKLLLHARDASLCKNHLKSWIHTIDGQLGDLLHRAAHLEAYTQACRAALSDPSSVAHAPFSQAEVDAVGRIESDLAFQRTQVEKANFIFRRAWAKKRILVHWLKAVRRFSDHSSVADSNSASDLSSVSTHKRRLAFKRGTPQSATANADKLKTNSLGDTLTKTDSRMHVLRQPTP